MTRLYYTGQYLIRRAGRQPNSFTQIKHHMPAPEALMVSGRPAAGWSLETWRTIAETRSGALKKDMLAAIDELEAEAAELEKKYKK